MTALLVVIAALATYRLTRLVTTDRIMQPLRDRITSPWLRYLTDCDWCLSIWFAPGPAVAVVLWPDNRAVIVVLVALALSAVTGLLALWEQRIDL